MTAVVMSLFAGVLTTLSPCVLPVLPAVALGALARGALAPLALAAGLAFTFTACGLLVSAATAALDPVLSLLRPASAALLVAFGVVLLSPLLQERFALAAGPLTARLDRLRLQADTGGPQTLFLLGALLGVVWAPCSGPTLGAAALLAAGSGGMAQAALVMLVFSVGACLPLLAVAYGWRRLLTVRRATLHGIGRAGKAFLGAALIACGLLVLTGADRKVESAYLSTLPPWLIEAIAK